MRVEFADANGLLVLNLWSLLAKASLDLCDIFVLAKLILAILDSTLSLCLDHSFPHRWDSFFTYRVAKIRRNCHRNICHVTGRDNPADCLSHGLTPARL